MQSNRSFNAWLQRWFTSVPQQGLDITDRVQPVVVVDDVSDLQVPPIQEIYGGRVSVAAVAAEWSFVVLAATSRPLLLLSHLGAATVQFGLAVNDPRVLNLGTNTPVLLEGELTAGGVGTPTAELLEGSDGSLPTGWVNGQVARGDPGLINVHGTVVQPGQFFVFTDDTVNAAVAIEMLTWVELEQGSLETSRMRSVSG